MTATRTTYYNIDVEKESDIIVKAMMKKVKKDLKPINKICKQCKQEYTKEEMECGHCFNCGEHILESF